MYSTFQSFRNIIRDNQICYGFRMSGPSMDRFVYAPPTASVKATLVSINIHIPVPSFPSRQHVLAAPVAQQGLLNGPWMPHFSSISHLMKKSRMILTLSCSRFGTLSELVSRPWGQCCFRVSEKLIEITGSRLFGY